MWRAAASSAGRLRSACAALGSGGVPLSPTTHRLHSSASAACDVAVVGGGVIGSSVALHLAAAAPDLRVTVFERDPTYARASAPRSAGGIRQQFSLRTNVELSLYGVQFLKEGLPQLCEGLDVDPDVQFKENGYLVLASPGDSEALLRENVAMQHQAGADWITLLDPQALQARFPWLSTEDVALGALGERNEGYFDPWALLQAMRKAAMARGVTFVPQPVTGLAMAPSGGRITSVELADGSSVAVGSVVNAAGAQGGHLVSLCAAGRGGQRGEGEGEVRPLPVVPRKRCMWLVRAQEQPGGQAHPVPPQNTPLTIDSSGVYFRSEGSTRGTFVCGVSPPAEDDPDFDASDPAHMEALDIVDEELFEERVWPALATRAPALEALKVESSWAGFYEYNTLDQNGVVGFHPDVANFLLACGFSGHGLQQSPGVGRACTELLLEGTFKTIDLSCFGFDRVSRGEPLFDRCIY